jgi:hypothetical protein
MEAEVEPECSAAAEMLGLPRFVLLAVSDHDGECEQAVETTVDLVGCPECGAVAQLHDRRPCWVLDLPAGWAPGDAGVDQAGVAAARTGCARNGPGRRPRR